MKSLFDTVSFKSSKIVTKTYSTSFSLATKMLHNSIRGDIYNIYGFVRFADEIVDTFHDYDKEALFDRFSEDLELALENKISLNPILNSFQYTFHKYNLDISLVNAFMKSMRLDLYKTDYLTDEDYKAYIYGSADVACLGNASSSLSTSSAISSATSSEISWKTSSWKTFSWTGFCFCCCPESGNDGGCC